MNAMTDVHELSLRPGLAYQVPKTAGMAFEYGDLPIVVGFISELNKDIPEPVEKRFLMLWAEVLSPFRRAWRRYVVHVLDFLGRFSSQIMLCGKLQTDISFRFGKPDVIEYPTKGVIIGIHQVLKCNLKYIGHVVLPIHHAFYGPGSMVMHFEHQSTFLRHLQEILLVRLAGERFQVSHLPFSGPVFL
jgi:hypothetical protein